MTATANDTSVDPLGRSVCAKKSGLVVRSGPLRMCAGHPLCLTALSLSLSLSLFLLNFSALYCIQTWTMILTDICKFIYPPCIGESMQKLSRFGQIRARIFQLFSVSCAQFNCRCNVVPTKIVTMRKTRRKYHFYGADLMGQKQETAEMPHAD